MPKIFVKFCPVCKSSAIAPYAGLVSGNLRCKQCGFVGNFFLEKMKAQKRRKGKKSFKSKSS